MVRMLCIVCPMGCELDVGAQDGTFQVRGAQCKLGVEYGAREAQAPRRVLTTTLATSWGRPLPVRSAAPVDRSLLLAIQRQLAGIVVDRPVAIGETVLADLDGQGTPLVATADGGPS
jgi:CxxC motif-containing protein